TDAHTLLLDVARARRRAVDAAAAGRRVGDPELLMRVGLSALGALHTTQLSNDPEILVLVQDVLAAMGSQHPDLRARLLAASAYYRAIPEAQRVEPEAIEAVALARETGDVPALLTALEAMCIVLDSTGRAGERLVVADELVTAATAAQDRLATASGHFWRATGRLAVG